VGPAKNGRGSCEVFWTPRDLADIRVKPDATAPIRKLFADLDNPLGTFQET
jgi:hypothetical protein